MHLIDLTFRISSSIHKNLLIMYSEAQNVWIFFRLLRLLMIITVISLTGLRIFYFVHFGNFQFNKQ